MTVDLDPYLAALQEARQALKAGDKSSARDWAQTASRLRPENEDPWLILAAVGSPRASLEYLNRALSINPTSPRARQGMHWAIQRYRASEAAPEIRPPARPLIATPIPREALVRQRPTYLPWVLVLAILLLCLVTGFGYPLLSSTLRSGQLLAAAQVVEKATRTLEPTATELPTDTPTTEPTATPTDLPTITPSPTATETPTLTLIPTETETPLPTDTPEPIPTDTEVPPESEPELKPNGQGEPPAVEPGEHWVDVDLSQQRVYAYEGDQIVDTFLVSTGTRYTPTVLGAYRIYVKYRSADMSGPGYFLPDVPYVMYFYKGYGLHGTYWHSNFGVPMSHGCVNLRTREAKWLFDWAPLGTLVYVHR